MEVEKINLERKVGMVREVERMDSEEIKRVDRRMIEVFKTEDRR